MTFDPDLLASVFFRLKPFHIFFQDCGIRIPDGILVEIEIDILKRGNCYGDFNLLFRRCNLCGLRDGRRGLTFHLLIKTSTTTECNANKGND